MIFDSSALLALVFREPSHRRILDVIGGIGGSGGTGGGGIAWLGVGAPTLAETAIVLASRLGRDGRAIPALLVQQLGLAVVPFEAAHALAAREAFLRYGRGRHPANLNFGDCLTYATAKVAGLPLVFVGEDFTQTDLVPGLG